MMMAEITTEMTIETTLADDTCKIQCINSILFPYITMSDFTDKLKEKAKEAKDKVLGAGESARH